MRDHTYAGQAGFFAVLNRSVYFPLVSPQCGCMQPEEETFMIDV
jgi:hypothetical protein